MRHNYWKKLLALEAAGCLPHGTVTEVDIRHDDWCGIYRGDYCDCDPDIRLREDPLLPRFLDA